MASLRSEGAWRLDPARFAYLEALARRLQNQPERVRRVLLQKLDTGLAEYGSRLASSSPAVGQEKATRSMPQAMADSFGEPLAHLNAYIRNASAHTSAAASPAAAGDLPQELASVRRFRRAWSNGRSREQVAQATVRKPANAGPLNSHALVLQSLALLADLSPDYLRRFLTQVESLQWLDHATEKRPTKHKSAAGSARGSKRTPRSGPKK